MDRAVGDARGLAAGGVADGDLGGAGGTGDVHGLEHVHGLARLANRNDKRLRAEDGLAIAELAGVVDIGREAGDLLEVPAPDHGRVEARAHPHEEDAFDPLQPGAGLGEVIEGETGGLDRHEAADGVGKGGGLLHDLLAHVGVVGALVGACGVEGEGARKDLGGGPVEAGVVDAVSADAHELPVGEEGDLAGVGEKGGEVARQEHLALAVTYDDAAGVADAGTDHDAGFARAEGDDRLRTGQARAGLLHGGKEVASGIEALLEEVGDGLGVGLAVERVAAPGELGTEGGVVFDDAVVDDDDVVAAAGVGVGVGVAGGAVGGPAGVTDARVGGGQGVLADGAVELGDLSAALGDRGLAPCLGQEGDAGRVVAAVFEVAQAGQQDRRGLARAGVGDDPAHTASPWHSWRRTGLRSMLGVPGGEKGREPFARGWCFVSRLPDLVCLQPYDRAAGGPPAEWFDSAPASSSARNADLALDRSHLLSMR